MRRGDIKSTSIRRITRKAPGGRLVTHFEYKKPSPAICGKCGSLLPGVPAERPFMIKKLSKTEKRPSRPYGGVLCSKCLRALEKEKAR
jgi:large subunit ribosomal protein L34e